MFPCQAVGEAQGDKSGLRAGAGDRFSRAAGNRVDALKHGPLDPATPAQPLGGRGFPLPGVVTPDLLSCSIVCAPSAAAVSNPCKVPLGSVALPGGGPTGVLVAVAATRAASHSGCRCPGKAPAATRGRQPGNGARTKPAARIGPAQWGLSALPPLPLPPCPAAKSEPRLCSHFSK